MSLMSSEKIREIAQTIRPHITPMIAARGQVTDEEVKKLCRQHANCQVTSDRTLEMIQSFLCE